MNLLSLTYDDDDDDDDNDDDDDDEHKHRDFILYLCPVGELQAQLSLFWQKSKVKMVKIKMMRKMAAMMMMIMIIMMNKHMLSRQNQL